MRYRSIDFSPALTASWSNPALARGTLMSATLTIMLFSMSFVVFMTSWALHVVSAAVFMYQFVTHTKKIVPERTYDQSTPRTDNIADELPSLSNKTTTGDRRRNSLLPRHVMIRTTISARITESRVR